jgi:transposase
MATKFTIQDFNKKYPDDDACLDAIFQARYGKVTTCPNCGKETKFYRIQDRKCYCCSFCGHQLHPLADTIFHKSDTSLQKWFFAIYLFSTSRNGVAAKELERQLGVTYKTAWRIAKQIRQLFEQNAEALKGIVEVDETYVGGKAHGKRGRGAENKTPVIGIVEREGKIKVTVTADTKQSTVMPLIKATVEKGSKVMTDEYNVYNGVKEAGYEHETVAHGEKEYARGNVHTNTLEGFWSQFKRSVDGTHHFVSPKYLQLYADEHAWKRNHRLSSLPMFDLMLSRAAKQIE